MYITKIKQESIHEYLFISFKQDAILQKFPKISDLQKIFKWFFDL